jgi:hypothetical protein
VFRRLVLARLVEAERLSEEFHDTLLSWVHSGFSVYGEQVVLAEEPERLERLARYVARAPMPFSSVELTGEDRVRVTTPPDPRTGEREVVLDPLEFLHALGRQVPDPRQHLVRYYGVYANRSRTLWQRRRGTPPWGEKDPGSGTGQVRGGPEPERARSRDRPGSRTGSWVRLLRRILEADPLLCPRCRVEMVVVAVITEPHTVDRILDHRHRVNGKGHDPFAERAPPAGKGFSGPETVH